MSIILDGTTGITTPGLTNTGTETLVNLTTTGNTTLGDASTDTLNVGNGGLIKDASGNVGIGVTPSAWTAGRTALQIYGSSTAVYFAGATTNTVFANNYYYNAGDKFVTASGYAQNYQQQSGGSHVWLTSSATSGGAGATATMNTLMTLDASGNLLVGTTTATSKVTVGGTSDVRVTINETSGSVRTDLYSQTGTGGVGTQSNHPFQLFTNGSERARIDTSGNLLINLTSSIGTGKLQVRGGIFGDTSSGDQNLPIECRTGGTIYSNSIYQSTSAAAATVTITGTAGYLQRSTASSQRYKDNIENWSGNGLETIMALQPRTFTYKAEHYKHTERIMLGLIAEEVAEVNPMLADYQNEDGTGLVENVRYAYIVVPLIKAIQEQNQLIQSLTDRISALEQK